MVAPDINRSGSSHSLLFLSGPTKLTETEQDSWSCSGTPVDCVVIALLGGIPELNISTSGTAINMDKAPDLVLSGINAGANLGTDIIYSGTASAARQGSFFGIPSVALSLVENECDWQWQPVISYITENILNFKSYWKPETFVNINFPNIGEKPSALVSCFPSMRYYNDRIETFLAPEGGIYCFPKHGKVENVPEEGSDWAEVLKNNAALCVVVSQPKVVGRD
jgi:5'-nucleotidase